MKSKISPSALLAVSVILAGCALTNSSFGQGSLTPPAGPGPTMKTLDQIEPRIPISNSGYVITNSGSYYLTHNLGTPRLMGGTIIIIRTDEVTLDLGGFVLDGSSVVFGRAGSGVFVSNGSAGAHSTAAPVTTPLASAAVPPSRGRR